jgi:hypothetical protein
MRKLHDEYEDPGVQIVFFFFAVIVFMVISGGPAIWTRVPYIRFFDDSGSRAVIESCVAEKGAWTCLKAFGTALDQQAENRKWNGKGPMPSQPDRGLIETMPTVVPKELTHVTDGASVTVTRNDVIRMCKGADRAECFGELQKSGLVYSNLAIDETESPQAEKS